jgi:sugar phosphate isomerase/epimerase
MRFLHPDGTVIHLAYSTNVHPGEDLEEILAQLRRYAVPVRARLGAPVLGLGLWLPASAARALAAQPAATARLAAALAGNGLEVVTLNGFPYQGFHAPVVKRSVYQPDWSCPERLRYTIDLARVLAGIMPADVADGSISTLPFGWAAGWDGPRSSAAARHLGELAARLRELAAESGRRIRVAVEPEPGCVAETIAEAEEHLAGADASWIGICLDACHFAVAFERPAALRTALPVVKAQVSCAVQADRPRDPATARALASFAEPVFLHQTREDSGLEVLRCDDLAQALRDGTALPGHRPWRVHFHVPVHAPLAPPLRSTQDELRAVLGFLLGGPRHRTRHLEVETYTWPVLPGPAAAASAAGLVEGIAAELDWTRRTLIGLGLKEL